jgi:DNA (cytosine-5)-methyltransferase 1
LASFKDLLNEDCPYSAVVAIAELTDVILMTEEFINQQCPTELRCGDWKIGRYAFKLENIRVIAPIPATGKQGLWKFDQEAAGFDSLHLEPWNPADFGKVQHKAEADGQLNLLEFDSNEPPEPDDYPGDLEAFKKAYLAWAELQEGTAEEYQHITPEEIWNQSDNGNGSIFVQASVLASPTPGLNVGDDRPISSANKMNIADESLTSDSPADQLANIKLVNFISEIAIPDRPRIITASPPCQPFSHDGQRLAADDSRNCFPDVLRGIRDLQPQFAIIENVAGLLNCPERPGSNKLYFAGILNELSESGYDVEWQTISSAHFATPWRRERVIIVAIARSIKRGGEQPTSWQEQTRNTIESIGAYPGWGSGGPGIPRSWVRFADRVDESTGEENSDRTGASPGAAVADRPQIGVASRDSDNRDRRAALGNALDWRVAAIGLKRVEYLSAAAEHRSAEQS